VGVGTGFVLPDGLALWLAVVDGSLGEVEGDPDGVLELCDGLSDWVCVPLLLQAAMPVMDAIAMIARTTRFTRPTPLTRANRYKERWP